MASVWDDLAAIEAEQAAKQAPPTILRKPKSVWDDLADIEASAKPPSFLDRASDAAAAANHGLVGVGETAAHVLGETVVHPLAQGIGGAAAALTQLPKRALDALSGQPGTAEDALRDVASQAQANEAALAPATVYQPQTEGGQRLSASVDEAMALPAQIGEGVGNVVQRAMEAAPGYTGIPPGAPIAGALADIGSQGLLLHRAARLIRPKAGRPTVLEDLADIEARGVRPTVLEDLADIQAKERATPADVPQAEQVAVPGLVSRETQPPVSPAGHKIGDSVGLNGSKNDGKIVDIVPEGVVVEWKGGGRSTLPHENTPAEAPGSPVAATEAPVIEPSVPAVERSAAPTAAPAAGGPVPTDRVVRFPLDQLHTDAERMQYRLGADAAGVTGVLKDAKRFNQQIADVIDVWRDPATGKDIVVNGHQRFDLAKRDPETTHIDGQYIDVPTAQDARVFGALRNIAQNSGSAIDAAKLFRDLGLEDPAGLMEATGLPLSGPVARKGLHLSKLNDALFRKVITGTITEERGALIGRELPDHADQAGLQGLLTETEQRGKDVTDKVLTELIRDTRGATLGKATNGPQMGMFGDAPARKLSVERAEVIDAVKTALAKDRKLFGYVADTQRAAELARGGNVMQTESNAAIATAAKQVEEIFTTQVRLQGAISDAINEAARSYAGGQTLAHVRDTALERVKAVLPEYLPGFRDSGVARTADSVQAPGLFDSSLANERGAVPSRGLLGILSSERGAAGDRPRAAETAARAEGLAGEAPLPEKAGNIKLSRINAPDDVKAVLVEVAQHEGDFLGARRGVISLEETGRLADELGLDAPQLLKRRRGQAFNAEQAVAARRLLVTSATDVSRLAKAYVVSRSERDLIAFETALRRDTLIQEHVSGMTAEAGRALSSFRIMAEAQKAGRAIRQAAATAGRGGPERAAAIADAVAGLESGSQVHSFIWGATRPKLRDFLYYVWINALLSGPKTHAVNILSNVGTALWTVPETGLASLIGNVSKREAGARLQGMIYGTREGLIAAGRRIAGKEPEDLASKLETRARPGGVIGSTIGLPGRLLEASDDVFKAINFRAEIYALAERTAHTEGARGAAGRQRVAELIAAPTEDMTVAAAKAARDLTFQTPLGPMGAALMRFADLVPGGRVVMPFIRTPSNILRFAMEASPFAMRLKDVRAKMRGEQGPAARDLAIARMTLGSLIAATTAALVVEGKLSGDGPSDPNERRIKMLNGWLPNSIKVGDTWYGYGRIDPFSLLLSVTADTTEIIHNLPETDQEKLAGLIVSGLSRNLTNKTYLRGLSDMIAAVHDPDRYGAQWVGGLVGTVVPTGVAEYTRSADPFLRDARTLLDSIKARVPGQSTTLPARRDLLGRPMRWPETLGPTGVSPIPQSREGTDPVAATLADAGVHPGALSRMIRGNRLTGAQFEQYGIEVGKQLRRQVEGNIATAEWPRLARDERKGMLEKLITRSRKLGGTQLRGKYSELGRRPQAQFPKGAP